ncbi:Hypothetical_protein [Hexamita inflata]|uniref:Hypothetical_protein n=1 Tax=Hexamita inflata TaxID=28002 RepID=A0ABP1GDY7_9EUKA
MQVDLSLYVIEPENAAPHSIHLLYTSSKRELGFLLFSQRHDNPSEVLAVASPPHPAHFSALTYDLSFLQLHQFQIDDVVESFGHIKQDYAIKSKQQEDVHTQNNQVTSGEPEGQDRHILQQILKYVVEGHLQFIPSPYKTKLVSLQIQVVQKVF